MPHIDVPELTFDGTPILDPGSDRKLSDGEIVGLRSAGFTPGELTVYQHPIGAGDLTDTELTPVREGRIQHWLGYRRAHNASG